MKIFHYIPSCLIILLFCCMTSCGDSKRKAFEDVVVEWTGKKILFSDSMRLVGGEMIAKPEADFTIVSYYDSVGCTGCRMKLQFWNEFMERVDSVRGDKTVRLLVIAAGIDEKELRLLAERDLFRYDVVYDKEDSINITNEFPDDATLQTFLIDRHTSVIAIGNPLESPKVASLYLSKIADKTAVAVDEPDNMGYDFGQIQVGKKVSHAFHLLNQGNDTLKVTEVTTSCECTEGRVTPAVIPPASPYRVDISFVDTTTGSFIRRVTVSFENKPDIDFEISGIVTNHFNKPKM